MGIQVSHTQRKKHTKFSLNPSCSTYYYNEKYIATSIFSSCGARPPPPVLG